MDFPDENSLVRRATHGDREAFDALWNALTPKLFGYLINIMRDKAAAEDMLQITWLKAIESLPRIRGRALRITPWLFAIARNECRQYWRKSGREVPLDAEKHDGIASEKSLDEKALADQILGALSENDREIMRLRYIAELPLRDISKILNINPVAARVRIHRALARARQILKHHEQ